MPADEELNLVGMTVVVCVLCPEGRRKCLVLNEVAVADAALNKLFPTYTELFRVVVEPGSVMKFKTRKELAYAVWVDTIILERDIRLGRIYLNVSLL